MSTEGEPIKESHLYKIIDQQSIHSEYTIYEEVHYSSTTENYEENSRYITLGETL